MTGNGNDLDIHEVKTRILQSFTDFFQDIGNGGVYIRTDGGCFIGQQVSLTFFLPKIKQDTTVNGEVARVDETGIGVKFKDPLNIT